MDDGPAAGHSDQVPAGRSRLTTNSLRLVDSQDRHPGVPGPSGHLGRGPDGDGLYQLRESTKAATHAVSGLIFERV